MIVTREMRRQLERDNQKQPQILMQVPTSAWPLSPAGWNKPIEVWRSKYYLVQVFQEKNDVIRASVNKIELLENGRWSDGLTWDDLQGTKQQIGRGGAYAIEVYPNDDDVVNVANMRHLWILPAPLNIGWFKNNAG